MNENKEPIGDAVLMAAAAWMTGIGQLVGQTDDAKRKVFELIHSEQQCTDLALALAVFGYAADHNGDKETANAAGRVSRALAVHRECAKADPNYMRPV